MKGEEETMKDKWSPVGTERENGSQREVSKTSKFKRHRATTANTSKKQKGTTTHTSQKQAKSKPKEHRTTHPTWPGLKKRIRTQRTKKKNDCEQRQICSGSSAALFLVTIRTFCSQNKCSFEHESYLVFLTVNAEYETCSVLVLLLSGSDV